MTTHEKVVLTAYTGVMMCEMSELLDYLTKKLGYPVFDAEIGSKGFLEKIKPIVKDDFMEVIK